MTHLRRTALLLLIAATVIPLCLRAEPAPIALAVLGDSDSHSYQDRIAFPPGTTKRGGALHAQTLQWTEVLARLRPHDIDLGLWDTWGQPHWRARLLDLAGVPTRVPPKEDYRYNFAVSGDDCDDLFDNHAQAPRLLRLMDADRARWRQGVVLIRIGINSLGLDAQMDAYARDGLTPAHQAGVDHCVALIGRAVDAIRAHHADTRIVLVGLLDNADWPPNFARWQSAEQLSQIAAVLDAFDQGLAALARRDPHAAFFDDRANFRRRFGARDAQGRPAYATASIGHWHISNTQGDAPQHGVVADGHAGTATNALWAADLIAFLDAQFGLHIAPVGELELAAFLDHWLGMPER